MDVKMYFLFYLHSASLFSLKQPTLKADHRTCMMQRHRSLKTSLMITITTIIMIMTMQAPFLSPLTPAYIGRPVTLTQGHERVATTVIQDYSARYSVDLRWNARTILTAMMEYARIYLVKNVPK